MSGERKSNRRNRIQFRAVTFFLSPGNLPSGLEAPAARSPPRPDHSASYSPGSWPAARLSASGRSLLPTTAHQATITRPVTGRDRLPGGLVSRLSGRSLPRLTRDRENRKSLSTDRRVDKISFSLSSLSFLLASKPEERERDPGNESLMGDSVSWPNDQHFLRIIRREMWSLGRRSVGCVHRPTGSPRWRSMRSRSTAQTRVSRWTGKRLCLATRQAHPNE